MNKEELHNIVEEEQPNICQIVAIKNNEIVYQKIKKYDTIVIARHVGADPDALCSQMYP